MVGGPAATEDKSNTKSKVKRAKKRKKDNNDNNNGRNGKQQKIRTRGTNEQREGERMQRDRDGEAVSAFAQKK